ncbi:MAG: ester cyclase [Caldilineaceae bacterium]
MSTELKTKIERFIDEVWNKGNLDALDEYCAANVVRQQPPYPTIEGIAAYRDFVASTLAIWPDIKMTVEEFIIKGETVVLRGFWTGAQTGPLRWTNLPPTGKAVKVPFCEVLHMVDDKIAEGFGYHDNLGMLQQLGLGAT